MEVLFSNFVLYSKMMYSKYLQSLHYALYAFDVQVIDISAYRQISWMMHVYNSWMKTHGEVLEI